MANNISSDLLAAMADGIGDLVFGSGEWVDAARVVLTEQVSEHSVALRSLDSFTLCEVAHNPPAYLRAGGPLAWHAEFAGASVEVGAGELADDECDFKVEADHSIVSNLARIQYHNRDPDIVASARARLTKLTRWKTEGAFPDHPALAVILRMLHDEMAVRTMPRFVFMTPEWVSCARHILSTRAASEKYAPGLKDITYTFSEEFVDTPAYAFPDGSHGGFWVRCDHGAITVGSGPLPDQFAPADALTKGSYVPVVPVGRTVNAAMSDADREAQAQYSKRAFRYDKVALRPTIEQTSPSGRGEMPAELGRVFLPLHDELGKRTSGELPMDFLTDVRDEWAQVQSFDRENGYDSSWLRYHQVDIYGNPRR